MGRRGWRLAALLAIACILAGASSDQTSLKEDMKFAAKAASQGLWREALFRWERQLKAHPYNARLHNNIAVASEGLGDYARALREYDLAQGLAAESKEIRANYQALKELCRLVKVCPADAPPTPAPTPAPTTPPIAPGGGPA